MLTVPPGDVHMLPSAEPQLPGSSSALRGRRGLADPAETLRAVRGAGPGDAARSRTLLCDVFLLTKL